MVDLSFSVLAILVMCTFIQLQMLYIKFLLWCTARIIELCRRHLRSGWPLIRLL